MQTSITHQMDGVGEKNAGIWKFIKVLTFYDKLREGIENGVVWAYNKMKRNKRSQGINRIPTFNQVRI